MSAQDAQRARDELRAALPERPIDWSAEQLAAYRAHTRRIHERRAREEHADAAETAGRQDQPRAPYAVARTFRPVITQDPTLGTHAVTIQAAAAVELIEPDGRRHTQTVYSPGTPNVWSRDAEHRAAVYARELARLEELLVSLTVEIVEDEEPHQ